MAKLAHVLAATVALLATPALGETTLRFVPQADLRILDATWTTAAITETDAQSFGIVLSTPIRNYGDVLRGRILRCGLALCDLSLTRSACRSRRVKAHLNGLAERR